MAVFALSLDYFHRLIFTIVLAVHFFLWIVLASFWVQMLKIFFLEVVFINRFPIAVSLCNTIYYAYMLRVKCQSKSALPKGVHTSLGPSRESDLVGTHPNPPVSCIAL